MKSDYVSRSGRPTSQKGAATDPSHVEGLLAAGAAAAVGGGVCTDLGVRRHWPPRRTRAETRERRRPEVSRRWSRTKTAVGRLNCRK